MKIASRPTTIASTPRPSANAARMIARPRICPAASGLRPIAALDMPARMPMPRGPRSIVRVPPFDPVVGRAAGAWWWSVGPGDDRGIHGRPCRLGRFVVLVPVVLDRSEGEHERQGAE